MEVIRASRLTELTALRDRWNALAGDVPFRQWEWLTTWWRHFQDHGELCVLVVESARGHVVGVAPWYLEHNPVWGRTLRFLGTGEACSDYLNVLAEPDLRFEVSQAVANWLLENSTSRNRGGWDVLQLEAISPDDLVLGTLVDSLRGEGCPVYQQRSVNCWRILSGGSWDRYLRRLSKPHRKHMRQSLARLQEGPGIQVHTARDEESFRYAWDRFVELHQRRRVSLGQPGCFADSTFHAFLEEAALAFQQRGQLALTWIEKEQIPLGALLSFTGGEVAYGYQMGTNPDFLEDSPGWMVVAAALTQGMFAGQTSLDLLRGNESYKSRMGAIPYEMVDVRVVAPQWKARVRHTAWLTGLTMKKWLKSGLTATRFHRGTGAARAGQETRR